MTFPFSTFDGSLADDAASQSWARHFRVAFLIQGVVLVLLGLACIALPMVSTIASIFVFGACLIVGGFVALGASIAHRKVPGTGWWIVSAVVSIITGGLLIVDPIAGAVSLTIVLAAFFFARACAAVLAAVDYRDMLPGPWGWMLLDGLLNLALAGLILWTWPENTLWLIGVMVGANLLWAGVFALTVAYGVRSLGMAVETPKT